VDERREAEEERIIERRKQQAARMKGRQGRRGDRAEAGQGQGLGQGRESERRLSAVYSGLYRVYL
jgi:hypothetical protein